MIASAALAVVLTATMADQSILGTDHHAAGLVEVLPRPPPGPELQGKRGRAFDDRARIASDILVGAMGDAPESVSELDRRLFELTESSAYAQACQAIVPLIHGLPSRRAVPVPTRKPNRTFLAAAATAGVRFERAAARWRALESVCSRLIDAIAPPSETIASQPANSEEPSQLFAWYDAMLDAGVPASLARDALGPSFSAALLSALIHQSRHMAIADRDLVLLLVEALCAETERSVRWLYGHVLDNDEALAQSVRAEVESLGIKNLATHSARMNVYADAKAAAQPLRLTKSSRVPEVLSALTVARSLLAKEKEREGLTNLKLQKLLYYCQGAHLAMFDAPLFSDEIEAWEHGPVVREVYHEYIEHGSTRIPTPRAVTHLSPRASKIIDEVREVYGQYSGWRLRELTHTEPPWLSTYKPGKRHLVIAHDLMRDYFKTRLR